MDEPVIRVLLIEEDAGGADSIRALLRETRGARIELHHETRLAAGLEFLNHHPTDVVLLHAASPDVPDRILSATTAGRSSEVPLVVLDGSEAVENGLEAIRKGAADHLVKSELNGPLLLRAICYAVERKRAEQAILESERRYRELLAAVKSYAYSVELAGGVPVSTKHGPGCLTTTGYDPEAYAADPYLWFRMIHPDDRDMVQQYVAGLLAGERVPPVEHRIWHRDGTTRWVRNTIVPHYDECGRLGRYDGLVEDITERRRAEEGLRHSAANLLAARKVQEALLPVSPPELVGYDLAGDSFPSETVGGDYYDFIPMLDGCLGIAIGDSSGHGLASALLAAELRATIRTLVHTYPDVGTILTIANRVLSAGMVEWCFVTFLFARLDPKTRTLVYSSAGHPPPRVMDAEGNVRNELSSMGIPLAIQHDYLYTSSGPIPLKEGEAVLFYSDGISEAASPDGALFGTQRITEVIREHLSLPAREIVDRLHQRVLAHCRPKLPADDLTAVVLKVGVG
jgi:PAS domain S-box-containing protein